MILFLNGFEVCPQSAEQTEVFVGNQSRNICGQSFDNSTSTEKHFSIAVVTKPLTFSEMKSLRAQLRVACNGDSFDFEGPNFEFSERGIGPSSGTFNSAGGAQFGLGLNVTAPTTYPTTLTGEYTVSFYEGATHYSVRSNGDVFVNGVLGAQAFLSINGSGNIVLAVGLYDDLTWIEHQLSDAQLTTWNFTQPVGPKPSIYVTGSAIDEPRNMRASQISTIFVNGGLAQLSFQLTTS